MSRIEERDAPESGARLKVSYEFRIAHRAAIRVAVQARPAGMRVIQSQLRQIAARIIGVRQNAVEDDIENRNVPVTLGSARVRDRDGDSTHSGNASQPSTP